LLPLCYPIYFFTRLLERRLQRVVNLGDWVALHVRRSGTYPDQS
jgi:hypothetical protein